MYCYLCIVIYVLLSMYCYICIVIYVLFIMLDGLKLKFSQNSIINNKLKATNDKMLYEAAKYDKIWGIGYSGCDAISIHPSKYGQNLLGKALMEIRNEM